jgi:hypothetical protein
MSRWRRIRYRHLKLLALDVPQRDVDGAERAAEGRATEGPHAVEVLPVVLDPHGILADEVTAENLDDLVDRVGVSPAGRLAEPDQASVRPDPHEVRAADQGRSDVGYFHRA